MIGRRTSVNVHIQQQPHDAADAARLYGEMRSKAEADVRSATIQTLGAHNEVRVARVSPEYSAETGEERARVLFTVNGAQYDLTLLLPNRLEERVMKHIATSLLSQVMAKLYPRGV